MIISFRSSKKMTRPESKNKLDVDDGKENEEHIAPSVFILKMIKCQMII